jgi:hypothetical protein
MVDVSRNLMAELDCACSGFNVAPTKAGSTEVAQGNREPERPAKRLRHIGENEKGIVLSSTYSGDAPYLKLEK